MKQFISNLLVWGLLLGVTTLGACTSGEDSEITGLADGETVVTLTATGVGESEESAVRDAKPEPLEVISQSIGNGLSLETSLTQDYSAQTRAGNALVAGSKFLVYIYQRAPGETNYTLRSWDPQIELTVGSQTPENFVLRQGFEYMLVCVAYLGNGSQSYIPVVAADQTINVADYSKDYIKQNIPVDLRTDTSSSKTISFEFNHCLTKLTLEIDTSQITGVYMTENDALTYGATNVKIPLAPELAAYDYSGATLNAKVGLDYNNSSNTQSVVEKTEVFLLDPTTTRAKIDIASLYLSDKPTVNILKETYTLLFNKLLSPGKSYRAKVSVKKNDGIIVGNIIWAPGNLYMESSGTYKFLDGQEKYNLSETSGEYFGWNTLDPVTLSNPGTKWTKWDTTKDPCTKVIVNGGGWRTPVYKDLSSLKNAGNSITGTLNGTSGKLYANNTVFVPFAGYIKPESSSSPTIEKVDNISPEPYQSANWDGYLNGTVYLSQWYIDEGVNQTISKSFEYNINSTQAQGCHYYRIVRCCKDKP